MWTKATTVTFIVAAFAAHVFLTLSAESAAKECVPMEDVTALLFQKYEEFTSWNGQKASRLECMGGCDGSDIASVTCTKETSYSDGVAAEWICQSTDESNGMVFDELNIICDSFESQAGSCLRPGSCRLQYKLRRFPMESDDMICRAVSFAKQWGKDAVKNIRNTLIELKEGAQECAKGDLLNCVRDARYLIGLSVTQSQGQTLWSYAKMAGSKVAKLVGWKTAATAGAAITVAGFTYSIAYCSDDATTDDLAPELVGQAYLELRTLGRS